MSYYYSNNYSHQDNEYGPDAGYPAATRGRGGHGRTPRGQQASPQQGAYNTRTPRQRGGGHNSYRKPDPEKVINGVPKPQHLSKTASEEKNDPLYSEAFVTDESQALAPEPNLFEIHTKLEGLEQIAVTLHSFCTTHQTGYAKRVPESALAYYCSVYAYARMLEVHQSNFRGLTYDEREFLAKVKEFDQPIPKALATVLAGIGNTTVPNGKELKFKMLPRAYAEGEYLGVNIQGYFGTAGPETQALYKSYPCIAVFAQRILADLGGDIDWNLPQGIRPADANAVHPNPNLLGYRPSVHLSAEQIAFLSKTGVTPDHFQFDNGSLAINISLILAVQRELNQVKGIQFSPFPNVSAGSTGQIVFSHSTSSVLPGYDVSEDLILRSQVRISNPVAFVASCAKYRSIYELGQLDT